MPCLTHLHVPSDWGSPVQSLEEHLANRVKALEESCQKESKATVSYVQQGIDKLTAALQKVVDAMKQTEAEFKARMAEHWARYQQTSDKLGSFEQVILPFPCISVTSLFPC